MEIVIRRVYEKGGFSPGELPVLVDRLWPRGMSKSSLEPVRWMKDWAPSSGLRQWFHAHPDDFGTFRRDYQKELDAVKTSLLADIATLLNAHNKSARRLVLLYGARDPEKNNAAVLRDYLNEALAAPARPMP